jgi:hypothetical protein
MLTERSKVPSEAKKRYFFPAKNPVDARREVVQLGSREKFVAKFLAELLPKEAEGGRGRRTVW